jgi:hypothetical protein
MTAKNTKRKRARGRTTGVIKTRKQGFGKLVARELFLLEVPGESMVDAARRLWLTAQSLVTASASPPRRKSKGKA